MSERMSSKKEGHTPRDRIHFRREKISDAIRKAALIAAAAIPMLGDATQAEAETIFQISATGTLESSETAARPEVLQEQLLNDPRVMAKLRQVRGLYEAGNIRLALDEAQKISDFYWAQNHQNPTIRADGGLDYRSNGVKFVDAPAGCVKQLGGRAYSFMTRDTAGTAYSVIPAHTLTERDKGYRFLPEADVASHRRDDIHTRECLDVASSTADSNFRIGVTVGGVHQLVGAIMPLKEIALAVAASGKPIDVSEPQENNPHLNFTKIMSGEDNTVCTVLPSAISELELKSLGIVGGSGRPLVTVNGQNVEAVGMQMNVTPLFGKYILCYASSEQIKRTFVATSAN